MTRVPYTFDPARWTPLARRPRDASQPIRIPRFDRQYDAPPGPAARIVPELSSGELVAVAFSYYAPDAAAVALQANGWWRPDVPDGADLRAREDGWFTGVFGAPARWRATFRFALHQEAGAPTWWTTGLKRRPVQPGVAWPGGRPPQHEDLPPLGLSPESYVIDLTSFRSPGARILAPASGPLSEPVIELAGLPGEPRVRCWAPAGPLPDRLPVVVFTDGETHLTRLDTPGRLARAVSRGELPAFLAVFVDSGPERPTVLGVPDGQARWIPRLLLTRLRDEGLRLPDASLRLPDANHRPPDANHRPPDANHRPPDANHRPPDESLRPRNPDLPPPDKDLRIPDRRVRASLDARHTVIVGSSYGGLTALFALIQAPETIGVALAQSVSLHRFPRPLLLQALSSLRTLRPRPIIRMHAGTYEGGEAARRFLAELEHTSQLHIPFTLHPGGHDWAWWLPSTLADLSEVLS